MGPALIGQTKAVIYNVYKFFRDKKLDKSSSERRNNINVYKTVAAAVGVSARSVMRVAKEGNDLAAQGPGPIVFKDPTNSRATVTVDIDAAIRAKYMEFINRKEKPTVNKIRTELIEESVLLCSYDYMKIQLKRLGYRFRPARPRIRLKRKCEAKREDECAGGSGFELEHVTVKLEPLVPGYGDDVEAMLAAAAAAGEHFDCDLRIKVEEQEYIDDVD